MFLRSKVSTSNGSCWSCLDLKRKYRGVKITFNCLWKLGFQVSGRERSISSKCACMHVHTCTGVICAHIYVYLCVCACVCTRISVCLLACVHLSVCE